MVISYWNWMLNLKATKQTQVSRHGATLIRRPMMGADAYMEGKLKLTPLHVHGQVEYMTRHAVDGFIHSI
ncbi:hypothetical protein D3C85_1512950 [compost metagenome]